MHKNFPESGRGLGYVTPTIFGSTFGYPGDSLASCSKTWRWCLSKTLRSHFWC